MMKTTRLYPQRCHGGIITGEVKPLPKDCPAMKTCIVLIAFIAAFGILFSACTKNGGTTTPTAGQQDSASAPSSPGTVASPPAETPAGSTEVPADNKSEIQKTQDQAALLVADGTYNNQATYAYHSGTETVDISISVKNDVVTAASVTGENPNPISARIIMAFNGALPDLVVGKRIDQIDIPRQVAGSSLTTAAFKERLQDLVKNGK